MKNGYFVPFSYSCPPISLHFSSQFFHLPPPHPATTLHNPHPVCYARETQGLPSPSTMSVAWGRVGAFCFAGTPCAPARRRPPPPPVGHSVGLLFLYGALDGHPFFPSHVASGRCFLSAAAASALAGVVYAFAEPSGWCVGAVLNVAGCAVCVSAAPNNWRSEDAPPLTRAQEAPPPSDIPSGCCSFTGPWTVTRSSLRMLRRVAAFCRPLRPVLPLVSFPRSRSPVVGVPGLC